MKKSEMLVIILLERVIISKMLKIRMYKTTFLSTVLYGCEILRVEYKQERGNKVLKVISRTKKYEASE
jgi:hypothetical protein